MNQKPAESMLRSTALLTGVGIVSQVLGFFYRVILSRMIGAEVLGLYQLIMPYYSICMSIAVTGLTVAVSALSGGHHATGNDKAVTQLLHTALKLFALLWLTLAVLTALLDEEISCILLGDRRVENAILLLLPVILLTGIENLHKHHFYGIGVTSLPAGVELAEQFIRTAAILGLLVMFLPLADGETVSVIVLGMGISEVFSVAVLLWLRRMREAPLCSQSGVGMDEQLLRAKIGSIAFPVGLTALLNNLIGGANSVLIPKLLIASGMPETDAMSSFGVLFGMTLPLLMLPFAFVNALCLSLLPRLTKCAALGQMRELNQRVARALMAASLLVLPLLALEVTLGHDLGELLFQNDRAGNHLLPLAVAVALSAYESVLATVLNAIGKQAKSAVISIACGLVQLVFTLCGTQRYGLAAVVAGMIAGDIIGVVFRLITAQKHTGLSFSLMSVFVAPVLAALLSGLCTNLLYRILCACAMPMLCTLLCCAATGLFLYLLTLWAQGIQLRCYFFRFKA